MDMIDYNSIILAVIALITTVIVTLAPVAVRAFFEAHTARLIQLKTLADNNQAIADGIVQVVQNSYKAYTNSEKFQSAFEKLNAQLHLPPDQLQQLIEQAVAGLTLAFGEEWTKLGEINTPTTPTPPVV
jgi:hypothetical protein